MKNESPKLCSFHQNKKDGDVFQSFSNYCQERIHAIINGWVDYGNPLIGFDEFPQWVDKAEANKFPLI